MPTIFVVKRRWRIKVHVVIPLRQETTPESENDFRVALTERMHSGLKVTSKRWTVTAAGATQTIERLPVSVYCPSICLSLLLSSIGYRPRA
ncbi:hypothetical protein BaRGS_00015085 [Batillaria attramentaria]|uniref:Uncharacterized protein n=1 Tax=Batillaria attramentaria TaxID=370345 RepID=A0ABD0L2N3_9CAEN